MPAEKNTGLPIKSNTPLGGRVRGAGTALAVGGALATVVGAALPWARFDLFGVTFSLPGLAGWGAVTAAVSVLALTQARRLPVAGALLGLAALVIGGQAHLSTGKAVRQRILGVHNALMPVNDKLMRVGLPPVEPFSLSGSRSTHVGPGPLWTFWGGAALAVGSAMQFGGERLRRSCAHCGALWPPARVLVLAFCPACGKRVGPRVACAACAGPLERGDRFCAGCGASVPAD